MKNSLLVIVIAMLFSGSILAEEPIATLRGSDILVETEAPRMNKTENNDQRRARAYPMQPPTIPHTIRDYKINLNSNKCLFCHSRAKSTEMQAPMVSVTHFQNRDGEYLGEVSPRRYFCTQCHVAQDDIAPLVENVFIDATEVAKAK